MNHCLVIERTFPLLSLLFFVSCNKLDEKDLYTEISPILSTIQSIPPAPVYCDNRKLVPARLVPMGKLSVPRFNVKCGSAGSKILFAGGWIPGGHSSRVDIYDTITGNWTVAELTIPQRDGMAVVSLGNKIFFAGGGDNDWIDVTARVDIYDAGSNRWSTAELSEARNYLTAVTLGNKVFFAGGGIWGPLSPGDRGNYHVGSTTIDIYDNTTNTWSVNKLSIGRFELSATVAGDKIYFSGGLNSIFIGSTRIDIFDASTNLWSISELKEVKSAHSSIVIDNKIYWVAGSSSPYWSGYQPSDRVEIRDITTGASSFDCVIPKAHFGTVVKNDEIIFFIGNNKGPGDQFDIYNRSTQTWSIGVLPFKIHGAEIISANNSIYVAGAVLDAMQSRYSDQVWKLEF